MSTLLPYMEIWKILDDIISNSYWLSGNKIVSRTDEEGVTELIQSMDDYYHQTFNLPAKIDDLVHGIPGIDFSYRYKTAAALKQKLGQINVDKLLYQAVNDILGLRFILKTDNGNLIAIVEQFLSHCPLGEQAYEIEKQTIGNHPDKGKIVVHLNIKNNHLAFPIELQFCTRSHALLNEYMQGDINKIEDIEQVNYAIELRDWLELVSWAPEEDGIKIQSYVDYVYEKNFIIEEDDPKENKSDHNLHYKLSNITHLRFIKQSKIFIYSKKVQTIMLELPDPRTGKDTYLKMKKHFPSENIGIMGAKDIQTLLRAHRELKLTKVTRSFEQFLKAISETKNKVYAFNIKN